MKAVVIHADGRREPTQHGGAVHFYEAGARFAVSHVEPDGTLVYEPFVELPCPAAEAHAISPVRMQLDAVLALLREKNVAKASFHVSGELESVEFAPDASFPDDEAQHDTHKPEERQHMKPSRAAGGLVPRRVDQ